MNIKLFESFQSCNENESYWIYSDGFLKIHKILYGANKGKIQFNIIDKDKSAKFGTETFDKYSMMYGVAKLLDTKYVNIPEIREITIGPILFKKVQINTMEAILTEFIKDLGYDSIIGYTHSRVRVEKLINIFGDEIKSIALNAVNLGDIFDGLKQIKNRIIDYEKVSYELWRIKTDTKKFNL